MDGSQGVCASARKSWLEMSSAVGSLKKAEGPLVV